MKILVLGGDGFCGWPTSLHLSNQEHDITIIDNLSRRKIDIELEVNSLTPICTLSERLHAWQEVAGKKIEFISLDIAKEYDRLLQVILAIKPDAIIHFAEQRAAPYSMKTPAHKRYTVDNNISATHNVLCAIVESTLDIHLIHLGTMGVYGYGAHGTIIPEGYLQVEITTEDNHKIQQEILHPVNPGSIYHMSKTLDQLLFFFYNKNDKLRITDLHQGIVWGIHTQETQRDKRLINRFDYDGDYGTVLNRFLVQAAISYPLTVHGTGGQTRAFINIQDTVKCIDLALSSPPNRTEQVQIFNQMTESHTVIELAELISEMTGTNIQLLDNPRKEANENDLRVSNRKFLQLGLEPVKLKSHLLAEVMQIAQLYKDRIDTSKIVATSKW
jgi:UDP-sulfoquinovose synthase